MLLIVASDDEVIVRRESESNKQTIRMRQECDFRRNGRNDRALARFYPTRFSVWKLVGAS
jgi:hypothetical protein